VGLMIFLVKNEFSVEDEDSRRRTFFGLGLKNDEFFGTRWKKMKEICENYNFFFFMFSRYANFGFWIWFLY